MQLRLIQLFLIAILSAATWLPPPVDAATNAAKGGIGGIDNGTLSGGDGTGAARITIRAHRLALVKQARGLDGSVLPPGADVETDSEIYFLLLVENPTVAPGQDLQIADALDENAFLYIEGSLETATAPSGSTDSQLWSAAWRSLTDQPGSMDSGSAVDSGGDTGIDRITIGAHPDQTNQSVAVPAGSIVAYRFRVRVK